MPDDNQPLRLFKPYSQSNTLVNFISMQTNSYKTFIRPAKEFRPDFAEDFRVNCD